MHRGVSELGVSEHGVSSSGVPVLDWVAAASKPGAPRVVAARSMVPAHQRCLPVDEALAPLLPDAGLLRGRIVGCSGQAAWSLALALIGRAVTTGSWAAFVATSSLGLEAAGELGVVLSRVVLVDADRSTWAERVAAAADGFDVIVTCPPIGAERVVRRVQQRLQAKGAVLVAVDTTAPSIACDLELSTVSAAWAGIGVGHGILMARRVTVRSAGRRQPRPIECELLLPDPNGRVRRLELSYQSDEIADERHERQAG